MKHTADWIEDRIRWCGRKHSLPQGRTLFWSDVDPAIRQLVANAIKDEIGRLVLLAYDSPTTWTLVGTRRTIGICDDRLRSLPHADIHDIRSRDYPPPQADWESLWPQMGQLKMSWEMILIIDVRGGGEVFWVPPGSEAFAIWNVLLMLANLLR